MLGRQGAQNIGLSKRKLKSALNATNYDHNAFLPQTDKWTDRRTDAHHGNSVTIRSNERIAR